MHPAGVNVSPPVTEPVGIISFDVKSAAGVVLQYGDRIILSFQQEFNRFGPKLSGVETVEKDRSSSSLSMTNFTSEDRFPGRVTSTIELEIAIADHLNEFMSKRFRRAAQRDVPSWIGRPGLRAEFTTLLIHDSFATDDDDIFLQVIKMLNSLYQTFQIERMLRQENDVRATVG